MTRPTPSVEAIRKRDGRVVTFDLSKISRAIRKAFLATSGQPHQDSCDRLARQVYDALLSESDNLPTVEGIQDTVEKVLIDNGHVQTAKAYMIYRDGRSRQREMKTRLMQIYEEITFSDVRDSDIKRENANIDGNSAMGTMLRYGCEGAKQFYDMFMLKPEHAKAHTEGDIHIADLDFYGLTTTCCQIDIVNLFRGGFSTGHGTLREPNHITSYAALACIAIQANQNDQHGGQSITNFDYGLACGVAKTYTHLYRDNLASALELLTGYDRARTLAASLQDDIYSEHGLRPTLEGDSGYAEAEAALLVKEVDPAIVARLQEFARTRGEADTDRATYKAMVALVHNLNTMHSRAGAQTPFSTVNYGMDTSPEGRMVMKNMLLATEAGLGRGETPIFPIQVFRVKEGVNYNPGDPNYDLFQLACRVSAKRMYPNFSFVDAPFNLRYYKPEDPDTQVSYMGCRTRVLGNAFDPNREISAGRGNLSFSSVNLPRLAIKANRDIGHFFEELDRKLDLVIDQLMERFRVQASKRVLNYPFLMGQGVWLDSENLKPDDTIGEVLKHGSLTVGFIGLAETLVALVGSHHGQSEAAQNLGLEIVGHMRARLDAECQKRKMNFTLIATPAEGLSGRFVRLDKRRYGEIPGVTDRDYYTNSFHIPVHFPIGIHEKIKLESPYHALTNAGHITYVELDGAAAKNLQAFEKIVRTMKEEGIGYGSINHPIDQDPACGYSGIIDDECPGCGRTEEDGQGFERIRRITGYLVGSLNSFNNAKRAEERDRVKHSSSLVDN